MPSVKQCGKCLLTTRFSGISIGSDGLCTLCKEAGATGHPHIRGEAELKPLREDLDRTLNNVRGNGDYDCLVGFSGGKDSIYLLYKLKRYYPHLRVLAVTINQYFLNEKARMNIKSLIDKLDVDHLFITPRKSFQLKFYRHLILHRPPEGYKTGVLDLHLKEERKGLCVYCAQTLHGLLTRYAFQNEIPLVLKGYAPGQPLWMFYEEDRQKLCTEDTTPPFMYSEPFNEEERSCCWNPKRFDISQCGKERVPRVLAPLHVWNYNTDTIRDELNREGLLSRKKSSPVDTNCYLNFLMCYIDYRLDGYLNMLPFVSHLIRHGFMGEKEREEWKNVSTIISCTSSFFTPAKLKEVEKSLSISAEEVIKLFNH